MVKNIITFFSFFIIFGCATLPPAKVTGNQYKNYSCGFDLTLPSDGWTIWKAPESVIKSSALKIDRSLVGPAAYAGLQYFIEEYEKVSGEIDLVMLNVESRELLMLKCKKVSEKIFSVINTEAYRNLLGKLTLEDYNKLFNDGSVKGSVIKVSKLEYAPISSKEISYNLEMQIEDANNRIPRTNVIFVENVYPLTDGTAYPSMMFAYFIDKDEIARLTLKNIIESFNHN